MNNTHVDAHRFVKWAFAISCIQLPASMYTFHVTQARIALIPLILSLSGVFAEGGWLYIYRQMKLGNIYKFPYGTKRMENALAFLDASFILFGVIYSLFEVVSSIQSGRGAPNLPTTSLLFLFGLFSSSLVFFKVLRARAKHKSPAIDVFFNIYRFAMLRDLATLFLLGAAYMAGRNNEIYIFWSDICICSGLLLLLGWRSVRIVRNNFTALIELPLPEDDQLLILQALAPDFDKMEMVGNIRTMTRGVTRVIEVEATLSAAISNAEILQLQQGIRERLAERFSDVDFHLILCGPDV